MYHVELVYNHRYDGLNPMQFGYETCKKGQSFGPAVRTHWLLHYVSSGKGYFTREGNTYTVRAGEIFVIPPFVETFYQADEQTPWEYTWIGFTAERLPYPLEECILRCPGAGIIFEDMRNCRKKEAGKSAYLCGKLWELFSLCIDDNRPQVNYVSQAISYMKSEFSNPEFSIAELAERLNLDRTYFSAMFKRHTGSSPRAYLCRLRLESAADLMVHHRYRPSTAALSCGYPDLYHFSKMFKGHFGVSPREYMRQFDQAMAEGKQSLDFQENIDKKGKI